MNSKQATSAPLVLILDDDPAVRQALGILLRSVGLDAELFASVEAFNSFSLPQRPCCLVLDVRLQVHNGLEFHRQLRARGIDLPVIFITGHGDIPMTVQAMKSGAVDFLAKPFREQDLLDAIGQALEKASQRSQTLAQNAGLQQRYQALTPREQEVLLLVIQGLLNKQIADRLALSLITVKIHRGNMMKKLQAKNFAELMRMAESLGLHQQ